MDEKEQPVQSCDLVNLEHIEEDVLDAIPESERELLTTMTSGEELVDLLLQHDLGVSPDSSEELTFKSLISGDRKTHSISDSIDTFTTSIKTDKEVNRDNIVTEKRVSPRAATQTKISLVRDQSGMKTPRGSQEDVEHKKENVLSKNESSTANPLALKGKGLSSVELNKRILESTKVRTLPALAGAAITNTKRLPSFPASDTVSDIQLNNITDTLSLLSSRVKATDEFTKSLMTSTSETFSKAQTMQNELNDIKTTIEALKADLTNCSTLLTRLSRKVTQLQETHVVGEVPDIANTIDLGHIDVDKARSTAAARVDQASKPTSTQSSVSQSKASEVAKRFKVRNF